MDHSRFDRITRSMAHMLDRRRAVAAGLGLAAAGGALAGGDNAEARPVVCRASGRYCTHNRDCCNERCRTGKKYPKATRNVCECLAPNGWCGATCTKLMEDERNCGSCGRRCKSNETCCDGGCVRLGTSSNCLACGDVCGPDETCCGESGGCVNLRTDNGNCGACGEACVDANCVAGICVPICNVPGETCENDDECCPGSVCSGESTCCSELGGQCAVDSDACSEDYVCQNSVVCVPQDGDCENSSDCCGTMTCDDEEGTCIPACSAYVGDACPSGQGWECCVGDCFESGNYCCGNPQDPCTQNTDACNQAEQLCGTGFDGSTNVVCVKQDSTGAFSNADCCQGLLHAQVDDTQGECIVAPTVPTDAWVIGNWDGSATTPHYICSLPLAGTSCGVDIQCGLSDICLTWGQQWSGTAWVNKLVGASTGICVSGASTTLPIFCS